jgi:hypothetical protein
MKSVYFSESDFWIVDEIERRAKIKGVSISTEIVHLLREHFAVGKEEVVISKKVWDTIQELHALLGG